MVCTSWGVVVAGVVMVMVGMVRGDEAVVGGWRCVLGVRMVVR